ncbi:FAD-dependent oxidoreductase [Brucella sp. NBRC 12950]|uniref:NAD(P)/FAD-dependent oxidoreductase n=1 Tax=Brucella sp. NBRC 12950 TaxID=2994518 RepID=UPI00249FB26C|nr:FAD-dependent oxidoreductase [Brucella sp. NBRC 12950]GLU29822.1 FAD-dependent oxidoreductase [Brucella sp. NBRC 12950]
MQTSTLGKLAVVPTRTSYDVVIVGGAVSGSSTAYFLAMNPDFKGSVLVVEKDSTYKQCATTLSTSAIRQQYSNAINVKISQYGVEFLKNFRENVQVDDDAPEIGFHENGYLFLATEAGMNTIRENVALQKENGADTVLLNPGEIRSQFPFINVEDLAGGSWGRTGEGWFDSYGLLQGFRRRARSLGVEYVDNEVVDISRTNNRITDVTLKTGERIHCGAIVNAAGNFGPHIARLAGLEIPVEPRRRSIFIFSCPTPILQKMPNVIDPSGVFCRPEGKMFLSGGVPDVDIAVDPNDFDVAYNEFDEQIWPHMAHRIPQFEAIRMENCWAGHYDYNTLDHNAIVGPHDEVQNFHFANGFSGHGLQQSPAIGRGLSELLTYGAFQSLDLSPLGYGRIARNEPFLEKAVI